MASMREQRERMVEHQLKRRGIDDAGVLEAMREVPREAFVPYDLRGSAYEDGPLPIGSDQTISQPFIVALMIAALELEPGDRVLEVGAGSGYAAAVMSRVAAAVYAIERHEDLARQAGQRIERLGYDNVEVIHGDGTKGWPEAAPFDAIVVAAAGPDVPESLRRQLAVGGRMVIPVGPTLFEQRLVRVTRDAEDEFSEEQMDPVRFVPLVGEEGWARELGAGTASDSPRREPALDENGPESSRGSVTRSMRRR